MGAIFCKMFIVKHIVYCISSRFFANCNRRAVPGENAGRMREECPDLPQSLRHHEVFPAGQFGILADRRLLGWRQLCTAIQTSEVTGMHSVMSSRVAGRAVMRRQGGKGRKRPWHSNLYKEFTGWPTILRI